MKDNNLGLNVQTTGSAGKSPGDLLRLNYCFSLLLWVSVCIYGIENVWWSAARPVSGAEGTSGSFSLMSTPLLLPCVCLSGLHCSHSLYVPSQPCIPASPPCLPGWSLEGLTDLLEIQASGAFKTFPLNTIRAQYNYCWCLSRTKSGRECCRSVLEVS